MKKIPVKFLKKHGAYNKGEIAGFTAKMAEALIKGEIAEPVKRPRAAKADA